MPAVDPLDDFMMVFRQEHRDIRDNILDLIQAARTRDHRGARQLVARLAELTGPHFRYEEQRLHPALVPILGADYVASLSDDHDAAIDAAISLAQIVTADAMVESDFLRVEELARGLLPHVSDCEGLSIMVERLPTREVSRILAARRRARSEGLDLLRWAHRVRTAPGPAA